MCLATFAIAHFLSFLFSPLRWPAPALRPLLPAFPFPPITGTGTAAAAGEGGRTCFQICSVSARRFCNTFSSSLYLGPLPIFYRVLLSPPCAPLKCETVCREVSKSSGNVDMRPRENHTTFVLGVQDQCGFSRFLHLWTENQTKPQYCDS